MQIIAATAPHHYLHASQPALHTTPLRQTKNKQTTSPHFYPSVSLQSLKVVNQKPRDIS